MTDERRVFIHINGFPDSLEPSRTSYTKLTLYISCAAELRLKTASFMMSPVSSVTAICVTSTEEK